MTLELIQIVGYLPHELKVASGDVWDDDACLNTIGRMTLIYDQFRSDDFSITELTSEKQIITRLGIIKRKAKPILRPLYDLTNPLEDGSIPWVEIAKMEAPRIQNAENEIYDIKPFVRGLSFSSSQQGVRYSYGNGSYVSPKIVIEITRFMGSVFHKKVVEGKDNASWVHEQFRDYRKIFDYLYSKHFDIYNLIEKGLAIDINQINTEK